MSRSKRLPFPRLVVPFAFALLLGAIIGAQSASAATASAVATLTTPVGAGTTTGYTFTLTPTNGQIGSFNLSAAAGWTILSVDVAPSGVALAPGSTTTIQGRGLTITSSSPLTVQFTAQAPCFSSNTTWSLVAKTGTNFTGSSVSVNQPSTSLGGTTCAASFESGREPADAAFNSNVNGPSENITSVPFTPTGDAIQVLVTDAAGFPRAGIQITLALTAGPGGKLSGPVSATSGDGGLATFQGSSSDPIAIDTIGQGYVMTPTGSGVTGTPSTSFGIYQEGKPCAAGQSCTVHGHSNDNKVSATVTTPPGGSLGAFVSPYVDVTCEGFVGFTGQVVVWKYTGDGSQTIEVLIAKSIIKSILNRGSDHIDVCFDSEGKPFVDKFGVLHTTTPGLLPDCNQTPDGKNCIVAQTASSGGDRLVTLTVEDGKARF